MQNLLKIFVSLIFLVGCTPNFVTKGVDHGRPSLDFKKNIFTTSDQHPLTFHHWETEGTEKIQAVLIGVHGFNDYGRFVEPSFAPFLNDHNILVTTYDQRGFGNDDTRGQWTEADTLSHDLVTFINLVHTRYPDQPIYVLGESMGGAVVIKTMAQNPKLPVQGVILSAPALWAIQTWSWYQKAALYASAYTFAPLKLSGGGIVQPTDHIENWRNWSLDPKVIKETRIDSLLGVSLLMEEAFNELEHLAYPSLLLHGEKDEVIPPYAIQKASRHFPKNMMFAFYEKGWHWLTRDHNGQVVSNDISSWILNDKTSLPSKAERNALVRLQAYED